jgi:hypothetical protein
MARPRLHTPAESLELRRERQRLRNRLLWESPEHQARLALIRSVRGEVTFYGRFDVRWVAVCAVCDLSRAGFLHRIDAGEWLVAHRAERHALNSSAG